MSDRGCAFTGHRLISAAEIQRLEFELPKTVAGLAEEGFTRFYAGGALGFDTLAAQAVLKTREENPCISLHLLLPCPGQERRWHLREKHRYYAIKDQADSFLYLCETYSSNAMFKRNRALINHSDLCVCYLHTEKGGTAFTVRYARKKGIRVINLSQTGAKAEQLLLAGM